MVTVPLTMLRLYAQPLIWEVDFLILGLEQLFLEDGIQIEESKK